MNILLKGHPTKCCFNTKPIPFEIPETASEPEPEP